MSETRLKRIFYMIKKLFIVYALGFILGASGCDFISIPKKEIIYYKIIDEDYTILSFKEITIEDRIMVKTAYMDALRFLKRQRIANQIKITIHYNDYAFQQYAKKSHLIISSNSGGYYEFKSREISLPLYNFKREAIAHEFVHAIIHNNKLKALDSESLASQLEDEIRNKDMGWSGIRRDYFVPVSQ